MRTRLWEKPDASTSTCVQVRDDAPDESYVWMHTNMGWIPIGNAPKNYEEAEVFAKQVAEGYGLTESSPERALYMAGDE